MAVNEGLACDWRIAVPAINDAYDCIRSCLSRCGLETYIEPLSHVLEVNTLRQAYKPKEEVRLLLMAESHVRRPEQYVQSFGRKR